MGQKDFQKFMMTLSRILGITGEMTVYFNRIPGDVIMISPKVTTTIDISYKHQNPDSLAVGEGISVNVGLLDDGTFEEILKNAYENNEFRFDYPEEVLEKLKPEGLGVSSKRFQEFIDELKEALDDRDVQTFFVTREGESYITLHTTQPKSKSLIMLGELGIKEIQGSRVTMELDKRVLIHSAFQEDLHDFWRNGVINVPFMDNKLNPKQGAPKEKPVVTHSGVEGFGTTEPHQPNTGEFKINTQQAHRVVAFFAPEVTLEEVQKLIEAIQLEEVRK